jgi:hypothetical protein
MLLYVPVATHGHSLVKLKRRRNRELTAVGPTEARCEPVTVTAHQTRPHVHNIRGPQSTPAPAPAPPTFFAVVRLPLYGQVMVMDRSIDDAVKLKPQGKELRYVPEPLGPQKKTTGRTGSAVLFQIEWFKKPV